MKRKALAVSLILSLAFGAALSITGCGTEVNAINLMDNFRGNNKIPQINALENSSKLMNFSAELFKMSLADGQENQLVSPVSVLCALAMTANGAGGDTRRQMERTLGMTIDELNEYVLAYMSHIRGDKALHIANSIWFKDDGIFTVRQDFLQINADFYGAGVYKAPFDGGTLEDINNWVKRNTNGMIEKILDDISASEIMYLVNALSFEAKWQKAYEKDSVRGGVFTTRKGEELDAEFMYSREDKYIETDGAKGFVKYYKGGKYAFAALLPEEGADLNNFAESLTGERLLEILNSSKRANVTAAIPKFKAEYSAELKSILANMGMTDAFDPICADFSGIGESSGNIYIGGVQHKTFIEVEEKGTEAAAVTSVGVRTMSLINENDLKEVILDRPFIYMIIDTEARMLIFIGTLSEI